jgi:hypothetical protein
MLGVAKKENIIFLACPLLADEINNNNIRT